MRWWRTCKDTSVLKLDRVEKIAVGNMPRQGGLVHSGENVIVYGVKDVVLGLLNIEVSCAVLKHFWDSIRVVEVREVRVLNSFLVLARLSTWVATVVQCLQRLRVVEEHHHKTHADRFRRFLVKAEKKLVENI